MNFDQIHDSLKADDNKALNHIYIEYGEYCVKHLQYKRSCGYEDAKDIFIDAVMIFREKMLSGKIRDLKTTRGYLLATCNNMYLERLRAEKVKKRKMTDVEHFFYGNQYVSLEEEWDESMNIASQTAFESLSEKCKDIIYYFYIDKLNMKEIASLMDLASSDVAKTTKSRCLKNLIVQANEFYDKLKQRDG